MAIEIPTKQNSEEPEFLRDSIDSPSPIGSSTDEVNTEENAAITSINQDFDEETKPSMHYTGESKKILDPMRVKVEIADARTPIVVLFGPKTSGKTMMLVRLTRWLKKNGLSVMPIRTFRPADDNYKKMCDSFNDMVDSNEAAKGTNAIDFMLLKVSKDGRPICQILEAPGEHYYNSERPSQSFPPYIHKIISELRNKKIYVILTEGDWRNQETQDSRDAYVQKTNDLRRRSDIKDKLIVVLNKVDLTEFTLSKGLYNKPQARRAIKNLYPRIFKIFENQHPITRFFRPSYATFMAFQSGEFSQTADGETFIYTPGADAYAKELWNQIISACN